jgi:hypothetical protein
MTSTSMRTENRPWPTRLGLFAHKARHQAARDEWPGYESEETHG